MGVPFGHWKTTTLVAGLRLSGLIALKVLDGPINRRAFKAYVDRNRPLRAALACGVCRVG